MSIKVNIYIGRMQPLHMGHASILKKITQDDNFTIILIGSAFQARTIKNPFNFEERSVLVTRYLESIGVADKSYIILPVQDYPYNDAKWMQMIQESVDKGLKYLQQLHGNFAPDFYLTGADRDHSTWYLSAFPQFKLDLSEEFKNHQTQKLNATSIREQMFNGDMLLGNMPESSQSFITSFLESESFHELKNEFQYVQKYKLAWAAAPLSI